MRILLAGPFTPDPRLGSAKLLLRLGREFERLGHEVNYLWLTDIPRWAQYSRIVWVVFPIVVALKVIAASRTSYPYDLIDVSGGDGWLIGLTGRMLAHRPLMVCRSHGWEVDDLRTMLQGTRVGVRWRRGLLMRWLRLPMVSVWARTADAIIVGSSPLQTLPIDQGWKAPSRIFVVPCGVDEAYFGSTHSIRKAGVLFVGSWIHRKGVQDIAAAYRLLNKRGHPIPLNVIGYGSSKEVVLGTFDPEDRMRVYASDSERLVDESELRQSYATHDILIFPSLYEGFGMVFLEAMASGMAVVATKTGGVVDIIEHKVNGWLIDKGDPEALAQALEELSASPEVCARLGAAARETARHLTWEIIAARTIDCYGRIGAPIVQAA